MITFIHIRNFTIVDKLDLDLSAGMTVMTGETGAGKSILLDALTLAMGGRADSGFIRHGVNKAEISVEFDISNITDAQSWLQEFDLADEQNTSCLIRRTLNRDGPSKGFINGSPVTVQSLKLLGELLVDIHGQHAHQSLLKRDLQRQALDDFGHHSELVKSIKKSYEQLKLLKDQQAALQKHKDDREARVELLEYQVSELIDLDLQLHELASLDLEQRKLSNITAITQTCESSLYQLKEADEGDILTQLNSIVNSIEQSVELDKKLSPIQQQLTEAQIQIQEAAEELRHYADSLSLDTERLQFVDDKLATIHDLSRKHRIEPESLIGLLDILSTELDTLKLSSAEANQLDEKINVATEGYISVATQLSQKREKAAQKLQKAVTQNMQILGMANGKFIVQLTPVDSFSAGGAERAEFIVSTNPGQPPAALNKIASGGELSRISLAIQVITAKTGRIPTLIFDEVDVGIGGGTAEVVGRLMRDLSAERQVMCVTHQPQVASLAHNHLHVSKQSDGDSTSTTVIPLDKKKRTDEIARMLGGIEITKQTRSHAEEMLKKGVAKETETA